MRRGADRDSLASPVAVSAAVHGLVLALLALAGQPAAAPAPTPSVRVTLVEAPRAAPRVSARPALPAAPEPPPAPAPAPESGPEEVAPPSPVELPPVVSKPPRVRPPRPADRPRARSETKAEARVAAQAPASKPAPSAPAPAPPAGADGSSEGGPPSGPATGSAPPGLAEAAAGYRERAAALLFERFRPAGLDPDQLAALSATALVRIDRHGIITGWRLVQPSRDARFDAAVRQAIDEGGLPPPPPELEGSWAAGITITFDGRDYQP